MTRKLLVIGSLQVIGFIVGFILLVPTFEVVGAAIAIFVSYSISCIPALIWSDKILLRYLTNTVIAVIAGTGVSIIAGILLPEGLITHFISVTTSVIVTLIIILTLKNISASEVKKILKAVVKGTP